MNGYKRQLSISISSLYCRVYQIQVASGNGSVNLRWNGEINIRKFTLRTKLNC